MDLFERLPDMAHGLQPVPAEIVRGSFQVSLRALEIPIRRNQFGVALKGECASAEAKGERDGDSGDSEEA